MKKFFNYIFVTGIILSFLSCEENFSPVVDYRESYALTCIIRGDTTLQVATLFSSYDLSNEDPSTNPAYDDAEVRLWYKDTVYWFKDSVISYPKYSDQKLKFYYLDNFRPTETGVQLEIEAMLKGGKRIKGKCLTPSRFQFDTNESSKVIPPVNTSEVHFQWSTEQSEGVFFVGRLRIKYFQNVDGTNKVKYKEIPLEYITDDGEPVAVFPQPTKFANLVYKEAAVTNAMEEISEGDPNKSNYKISNSVTFEVLSLDENVSRYYSSTLEDNSFTVELNELDYTNIEGGFGLFGAVYRDEITVRLTPEYIMSFGYQIFFEE